MIDWDNVLRDMPWPATPRPDYYAYLESEQWRILRHRKFIQQGARCERCGELGRDVHHKHYRTLGRENLSDLELLCRPCHEQEHGLEAA